MTASEPPATSSLPATQASRLREIPSVSAVVAALSRAGCEFSEEALTRAVRLELEAAREALLAGASLDRQAIEQRVMASIMALQRPRLAPIINATGVVIHTNLGRAPVSAETAAAMSAAATSAVALELEPESNERGGRMREIAGLLRMLTGAEAALVVNNGAAAVLLVLAAVAAGRSVVVSRSEAVEIGGGFRIPDVMRQSGARLIDVGTTNRTYVRDYATATDETTAAYLKVHPSNFRTYGFVHAVPAADLVALARERGVLVLEDLGSGALLDTARFGSDAGANIGSGRGGRCRSRHGQRRQVARRAAGRGYRRFSGPGRTRRQSSAGAGCARRQDNAGRCGGDPTSLRARGSRIAHSDLADDRRQQ